MNRISALMAGTALAALLATGASGAPRLLDEQVRLKPTGAPLLLAQAEETEEELLRRQKQEQGEQAQQPEAAPPAEEAPPPPPAEAAPPPPEEPAAPPPEEASPPRSEEPDPEAAPAPPEQPPAPAEEPQPPADQAAPPAAEQPAAPAEESAQPPATETPAPEAAPAPEAKPAPDQAPAPDQPPAPETKPEAPAGEQPAPAEKPAQPDATPAPSADEPASPEANPAPDQAPAEEATPEAPADGQTAPAQPGDGTTQSGEAAPEGEAPVLDSQKVPPAPSGAPQGETPPAETAQPAEPAAPPPATDAEAQPQAPARIESVTAEKGERTRRAPDETRRERPRGTEVLREIGDRIILELGGGQVYVESSDRPRMTRGARDVYYEDLPRGRTRQTVVRRDGTQVITIRNAYGDVIRRSRITPDGREYVLVYVDEDNFERVREWRDPGLDLPPMRLTIPRDEYILDSARVDDVDAYYDFLDQPPVERVERLYSVDEVKRSARIRDKVRRVDLDTVNFALGSANIDESEIRKLQNVATAMERLLEQNPAETFLIEGHTDAVGSEVANLALSDQRAEAVANALTNVFEIPPENLATQGYGEQYLKVRTQAPERENRRVAIRRITPLVAPVAKAN